MKIDDIIFKEVADRRSVDLGRKDIDSLARFE